MLLSSTEQQLFIETMRIQKGALVYRAINHPLRQQMLALLHEKTTMTVTEIYTELHLEQSVVSQHLAILRVPQIVSTRRDGKKVFYSINYSRLNELHQIAEKLNS
jgi:DNA-binding transcriptional ArsR family regulator